MKQIILFPKGQLEPEDKKRLQDADFIPIEVDDPSKIIFAFPNATNLTGDVVTTAALSAITGPHSGGERQKFAESVLKSLLSK